MALSRPALEILGISLSFTRAHPPAIVVAAADAIYRAAASRYHPDKGAEAIPLPPGVNLTELQAARDAVRSNPSACIKEIGRGERTSKEGKRADELAARLSIHEEVDGAWSQSAAALWDYIARGKLGLTIDEEMMDKRVVAYSTLHLNGIAILVNITELGKSVFYEYLRHKGTWFKRPVVKGQFSKKSPCPPNIPPELILESSAVGPEQGNFYDQSGPHTMLEGLEVLGSYTKHDLVTARAKERKAAGMKPEEKSASSAIGESPFKNETISLDPAVVSALKPSISTGSILQAATRGKDGTVRYFKAGMIVGVRVFDQKQRP